MGVLDRVRDRGWFVRILPVLEAPGTCVALLVLLFAIVSAGSGGYAVSRSMLRVHYPAPSQLVLISETGILMGQRLGVSPDLLDFWQGRSTTLSGLAGYRWDREGHGFVTGGFFEVLGGTPSGFVPQRIRTWLPLPPGDASLLGVIGRLKPGATPAAAQKELRELAQIYRHFRGRYPFPQADVMPLTARLRQPFVTYGAICASAIALPLIAIVVGILAEVRKSRRIRVGYWAYFAVKAVLFPLTAVVAIWEFTPVTSIAITGAGSFLAEPLLAWLFIVACLGWIRWCLLDQYQRCRVCLRRLHLPVRVGMLGAVILDTAGTEVACQEGHGALYMPEESSDYLVTGGWNDLLS